jgi:hypothetical protein
VREGGGRRLAAMEGASGGMTGGVGLRVGGGVAMVVEEWCLRQPRMDVCRAKQIERQGEERQAKVKQR